MTRTAVEEVLRGYVERGVFRSLGGGRRRGTAVAFPIVWHHGRTFRFVVDPAARTVAFPELLPGASGRSPMVGELRRYLAQFASTDTPPHRRIDPAKGRLRIASKPAGVSVGLAVRNRQWEYCTRKLVHLAQEVYLVFLPDGPYQEYRVEQLGLDPDAVWT